MSAHVPPGATTRPAAADIDRAAERIAPYVVRTPLVPSVWLSDALRADVRLKLEMTQITGSFKIRGAMNALLRLREDQPHVRRVVTASAGNHGQAIALAAKTLGLSARVYLPAFAPAAKRDAMRRLGAEMIEAADYDAAEAAAHQAGLEDDAAFVSAYSHRDVIAGAGTIAREMFQDEPRLDTIVVPLGGGGLLSGCAIAARATKPDAQVIGAEAEASPVFSSALAAGHVVTVPIAPTLADGLAGNMEADSQTYGIVAELADRVMLVAESSIALAMRELVARERLIAEGAGATAVGALLQSSRSFERRAVGVVLSGRNVDPDVLLRVMR
jgi:threonine dehydratase